MKKIEKYNGTKTYMFPSGNIATPEVMDIEYPAWRIFTHIVETDEGGEVMFAFQNLSAMRSMHNIDTSLTEDEAISEIENLLNTEPTINTDPTSEERIAAALEYQNLLNM